MVKVARRHRVMVYALIVNDALLESAISISQADIYTRSARKRGNVELTVVVEVPNRHAPDTACP